jgi:hypothetical protein
VGSAAVATGDGFSAACAPAPVTGSDNAITTVAATTAMIRDLVGVSSDRMASPVVDVHVSNFDKWIASTNTMTEVTGPTDWA